MFVSKSRISLFAIAAVMSLSFQTLQATASEELAVEATRKVNLAGRQRMLSQRMSMAACFGTSGYESRLNFEKLRQAHADFEQINYGLRFGDAELNLHEEGYKSVVDALTQVDDHWSDYEPIVEGLLSIQMMSHSALERMDAQGLTVLNDMNIAVGTMANTYAGELEHLPQILSVSVDFAGRQRMLTQKIAKEFCLVSRGINTEENLERMQATRQQFNLTQQALENGVPYMIVAAPTPEILAKLKEVDELWKVSNEIFAKVEAGGPITLEDIDHIVFDMDEVLFAMNEAVILYQDVHGLTNY